MSVKYEVNREEAKKEVARWMKRGTPLNVARADVQQVVINKIYNDFESRTCENCKLSDAAEDGELYKCDLLMNLTIKQARELIHDGFGCNRFEIKAQS